MAAPNGGSARWLPCEAGDTRMRGLLAWHGPSAVTLAA